MPKQQITFENIVTKGEGAPLLSQCFHPLSNNISLLIEIHNLVKMFSKLSAADLLYVEKC